MAQEVKELVQEKETKEVKQQKNVKTPKQKKDLFRFFKEVKGELKKVIWPDRKQLINNTITVLMACFVVGLLIWIADIGLKAVYDNVFK
jgi:preprotein translocase subunit SecE